MQNGNTVRVRDGTEFEFDNMRNSNVFKIRNLLNVLSTFLSNANSWKNR